jgi:ABC-2 type transport system permease protein
MDNDTPSHSRTIRTVQLIIQKEVLQVFRDKRMLFLIFFPPVIQLFVLAQAMTFEVKHTNLVLVDADGTQAATALVQAFTASGRFNIVERSASEHMADEALLTRTANAVLRIPEGFERDLRRGTSPTIQLILNAEDGAAAGIVLSYARRIITDFAHTDGARLAMHSLNPAGRAGVEIRTRKLYNPEGRYLPYMAIGLLASLVTLVGILLTSQNIAREKEIGTLEQLNVTPITKGQFILGKLIPFWVLGLLELSIGLLVIRFGFGIPFTGNVLVVYLGTGVYLLAALGLGLLVSTVARTQQQAQFVTFFIVVTFFFLGGIFTPIQSMPIWAQTLAEFNPVKHFVLVLRGVLLKGAGVGDILKPLGAMALFALVALNLAVMRYKKTA